MGGKSRAKALCPLLTPLSENPTEGPSRGAGLTSKQRQSGLGDQRGHLVKWFSDLRVHLTDSSLRQIARVPSSEFDSLGQGWGLRICTSRKFPGDADAAIPGTIV